MHTDRGNLKDVHWAGFSWLISLKRDMTHSYVSWLIHTWHDTSICDMSHLCMNWLIHMKHTCIENLSTEYLPTIPYVFVCVFVFVCVREKERTREKARDRDKERERERERESVCLRLLFCACVCERESVCLRLASELGSLGPPKKNPGKENSHSQFMVTDRVGTHISVPYLTHEWVTHTNKSSHTRECVTSHGWMLYVTQMKFWCPGYECVTHTWQICDMWYVISVCLSRNFIQVTDMTRDRYVICDVWYPCAYRLGASRGGGLGSSTIFKKFNEPYAPS